jgi:hypothetical protein
MTESLMESSLGKYEEVCQMNTFCKIMWKRNDHNNSTKFEKFSTDSLLFSQLIVPSMCTKIPSLNYPATLHHNCLSCIILILKEFSFLITNEFVYIFPQQQMKEPNDILKIRALWDAENSPP